MNIYRIIEFFSREANKTQLPPLLVRPPGQLVQSWDPGGRSQQVTVATRTSCCSQASTVAPSQSLSAGGLHFPPGARGQCRGIPPAGEGNGGRTVVKGSATHYQPLGDAGQAGSPPRTLIFLDEGTTPRNPVPDSRKQGSPPGPTRQAGG